MSDRFVHVHIKATTREKLKKINIKLKQIPLSKFLLMMLYNLFLMIFYQ